MNNQAIKKDNGKPRLDLVPLEILEPLARVREFAVKKYGLPAIYHVSINAAFLAIKTAEKELMEEVVRETKKAFWRDENEPEAGA